MTYANGKFAIITGASQGLGRAFAEEIAGRGKDLVLVALPGSGLPEVKRIIELAHHVRVEAVETDLEMPDAPVQLREMILEKGIEVDMLINNAGVGFNDNFENITLGQAETQVKVNVLALVQLTHLMLPELKGQKDAWILNVASMAAYFPMPRYPVYAPSKSFVLGFSLALREELSQGPVHVSVLCPNGIRTNRGCRALIERQGLAGRLTCKYPDEIARTGLAGLMRGRAIIVPGIVNKFLKFISGIVPRRIYQGFISGRWSRTGDTKKKQAVRGPLLKLAART